MHSSIHAHIPDSSTYLNYDVPDNGGQFGFYNDDAAGDLPESPATPMLVSYDFNTSGMYPPFLMFDLFFPNPSGPCEDGGTYADDYRRFQSLPD